jgi:hypothetical protein
MGIWRIKIGIVLVLHDPNNIDAGRFQRILDEHGLLQHMKGATHVHDHTLDLIITRNISHILSSVPTIKIKNPALCDNNSNAGGDDFAISIQ